MPLRKSFQLMLMNKLGKMEAKIHVLKEACGNLQIHQQLVFQWILLKTVPICFPIYFYHSWKCCESTSLLFKLYHSICFLNQKNMLIFKVPMAPKFRQKWTQKSTPWAPRSSNCWPITSSCHHNRWRPTSAGRLDVWGKFSKHSFWWSLSYSYFKL